MYRYDYTWAWVLGLAVVIAVGIIGAWLMTKVAEEKGYGSEAHVFVICFFLGLIGYLYVIGLPDKKALRQAEENAELLQKLIEQNKGGMSSEEKKTPAVRKLPEL